MYTCVESLDVREDDKPNAFRAVNVDVNSVRLLDGSHLQNAMEASSHELVLCACIIACPGDVNHRRASSSGDAVLARSARPEGTP